MKKPGAAPAPAPEPEAGKAEAEAAKPAWMSLDEDEIYKWNWEQARRRCRGPHRIPQHSNVCAMCTHDEARTASCHSERRGL